MYFLYDLAEPYTLCSVIFSLKVLIKFCWWILFTYRSVRMNTAEGIVENESWACFVSNILSIATGNVWLEEKTPQRWGSSVLSRLLAPPWELCLASSQLTSWGRSASACMEKKSAKILIYLRSIHQVNYKRKWFCPPLSLLDQDRVLSLLLFHSSLLFWSPLLFSLLFSLICNPSSRPSTWQY